MAQRVDSWIAHHAARTPDRVALVDLHREAELTYGEPAARVRAVAHSLQEGRWGEAGVAFVVPTRDADIDAEELRAWCRERLAAYKVPVRVLVVDELPRNATGKVLKAPLRDTAREPA